MAQQKSKSLTLKLSFVERNHFPQLIPQKADVMSLVIGKGMRDKVAITVPEAKAASYKVESAGGQVLTSWNAAKAKPKSFTFDEPELRILAAQVKQMDQQKSVPLELLDVVQAIQAAAE